MQRDYKADVPQCIDEIDDRLATMMLSSPTFADRTGYFPDRNIESVFQSLNEGLRQVRGELGEERYAKLRELSDQARAHFEADPDDNKDDAVRGRALILDMQDLLREASAAESTSH